MTPEEAKKLALGSQGAEKEPPKSVPMTDVVMMERTTPRTNFELKIQGLEKDAQFEGIFDEAIPQEELDRYEGLGEIGFVEQWRRQDKSEMIPWNPESFAKSFQLYRATQRLMSNDPDYLPEQKSFDEALIQKYITRLEEERLRGVTIGGRVMKGVAELPAFMIEFLSTGGAAAIGRKAVKKVVQAQAKRIVKSNVLKATTRTIAGVAGGTARTLAMPHRLAEGYAQRQINASLELTDKGIKLADEISEKPHISALKAFGDVLIENFSETTGPVLRSGVSKFIPRQMKSSLEKLFKKLNPNKKVTELWTKAGFNGFLEELGEERVGSFLRALTGVEDFGADNPDRAFDRIVASIPNGEELLVEALVLAVPGGTAFGVSQTVNMIQKRKQENKVDEPAIKEITEAEAEAIINPPTEEGQVQPVQQETQEPAETEPEFQVDDELSNFENVAEFFGSRDRSLELEEIEANEILDQLGFNRDITPGEITDTTLANTLEKGIDNLTVPKSLIKKEVDSMRANEKAINEAIDQQVDDILSQVGPFSLNQSDPATQNELKNRDIPTRFISETSIDPTTGRKIPTRSFDDFIGSLKSARILDQDATFDDAVEFLETLNKIDPKGRIATLEALAERNIREDVKDYVQAQPNLKKVINRDFPSRRIPQAQVGLRDALREIERAQASQAQLTRKEIEGLQNQVKRILRQSRLSSADKARFIPRITEATTQEKLNEIIPELQKQISNIRETRTRQVLTNRINRELKTTKVRKQGGKPVGRFTADIQRALDLFRQAASLSQFQAEQKIAKNLSEKHPNDILPEEARIENRALSLFGGLEQKDSNELRDLLDTLRGVKRAGRELHEIMESERKEQDDQAIATAINEIGKGKGLPVGLGSVPDKKVPSLKRLLQLVTSGKNDILESWNMILNILTKSQKGVAPGQSFLERYADVFRETLNERGAIRRLLSEFKSMAQLAYGTNKKGEILKTFRDSHKPVDLGNFKNLRNENIEFVITKSQARKKWMEMQDSTLQETFDSREGMAWTPEMKEAIENFLTEQDKEFARMQLDFYRDYYKRVNQVYRQRYGVDLPFNEFYSPISRLGVAIDSKDGYGEFLDEIGHRRGIQASALKTRVKNIKPLEFTSDLEVFHKHTIEMERFINWSGKVRELSVVFDDPAVKKVIEIEFGKEMNRTIKNFLDDFASGGMMRGFNLKLIDNFRKTLTVRSLALRPSIMIKQLASIPAYLKDMSSAEFATGILDFFNPFTGSIKEKIAILKQSEFLLTRGENIERDIRDALKSDTFKAYSRQQNFINTLMLNVQLGDQGAIVVGGWAVYRKAIKEGKSQEQALELFARRSNEAQQSSDLAELSNFQRGGTLPKLFTTYMTTPIQYLRWEMWAIRNYVNGRIPLGQAIKTFMIFHVLLPMIFQWISDFGKVKPKNLARAAIVGNLNALFIIGPMFDALVRQRLGLKVFPVSFLPTVDTLYRDLRRAATGFDIYDIGNDDFWRTVEGVVGLTGAATGLPLVEVTDMAKGLQKIYEGDYRDGIGSLLGWSEFSLQDESGSGGAF